MEIRTVTLKDSQELLAIYTPYVLNTAITFEYEVPSIDEFENRIKTISFRYPYLVLIDNNEIVGYAYATTFKGRKAYDWSVETTIYIKESNHHKGYGKALYEALEKELLKQNVTNMNACIAYANDNNSRLDNSSFAFHEKMGYTLVGRFHQCANKFNQWYDMVWMEKHIASHNEVKEFIPYNEIGTEK